MWFARARPGQGEAGTRHGHALARAPDVIEPPGRATNVAVAIATLDRPEALARCLDALLSNSRLPAQIVVVDQGQGVEGGRVIDERRSVYPSLHYHRQARRGLSASRNAAIGLVRSPIIAMTDDDCVPGRDWVAAIDDAFARPSSPDAVTGRVLPLGPPRPGWYAMSSRDGASARDFRGRILPWKVGSGGNLAARRASLDQIGGFDERLGAGSPGRAAEDTDVLYRLLRAGARIRFEPTALVYHERAPKWRRALTRRTYSYGIGAFCGAWLQRRDAYALWMIAAWLHQQAWKAAGHLRRHRWEEAGWDLASLPAAAAGLVHGFTTPPLNDLRPIE